MVRGAIISVLQIFHIYICPFNGQNLFPTEFHIELESQHIIKTSGLSFWSRRTGGRSTAVRQVRNYAHSKKLTWINISDGPSLIHMKTKWRRMETHSDLQNYISITVVLDLDGIAFLVWSTLQGWWCMTNKLLNYYHYWR